MNSDGNDLSLGVDQVSNVVWPIERSLLRNSLTRLMRANPDRFRSGVANDGFSATAFWWASALWAGAAAIFFAAAIPFTLIGVIGTTFLRPFEYAGFALYFAGLVALSIGIQRRLKYRSLRSKFQSQGRH
jgi:hypothetical protein